MISTLIIFGIVLLGNAFAIIGFNRACQYEEVPHPRYKNRFTITEDTKMILWKVKYYSELWFGKFWSKPVYSCPTCMASLHGFIPFLITAITVTDLSAMTFLYWIFYTLALSGLTTYINER